MNFKRLQYLSAAVAFSCLPSGGQAADWWLVSPEGNLMVFADVESIVRKGDDVRIVWLRADKLVGLQMLYHQLTRQEISCADHSVKVLQSRLIHSDPQFNEERAPRLSPFFAHPGSPDWDMMNFVCQYTPDAAQRGALGVGVKLPSDLSDIDAFVKDRRRKWISEYGYEEDPKSTEGRR